MKLSDHVLRNMRKWNRVMRLDDRYRAQVHRILMGWVQGAKVNVGQAAAASALGTQTDADLFINVIEPYFDVKAVDAKLAAKYAEAYTQSSKLASSEISRAYIPGLENADYDLLKVIQSNSLGGLKGIGDALLREIEYAIRQGITQDMKYSDIAREIRKLKGWNAADWKATRIARTEVTRSVNDSRLRQFDRHELEEVRWIRSSVIDFGCVCPDNDGAIYKTRDAYGLLPVHPNCQCYWEAVT